VPDPKLYSIRQVLWAPITEVTHGVSMRHHWHGSEYMVNMRRIPSASHVGWEFASCLGKGLGQKGCVMILSGFPLQSVDQAGRPGYYEEPAT
jgi:hypothetical protein